MLCSSILILQPYSQQMAVLGSTFPTNRKGFVCRCTCVPALGNQSILSVCQPLHAPSSSIAICVVRVQVLSRCHERLPEFDTRGLAILISSLVKLGHQDEALVKDILERCRPFLPNFSPPALASLMHGLAQLRHRPGQHWMRDFDSNLESKVQTREIDAKGVCILLQGVSATGLRTPTGITMQCCDLLVDNLHQLDARDLAFAFSAFRKFAFRPNLKQLTPLLQRCVECAETAEPQAISTAVRALPRMLWVSKPPPKQPPSATQPPGPDDQGQASSSAQTTTAARTLHGSPAPTFRALPPGVAAAVEQLLRVCTAKMDRFNRNDLLFVASGLLELHHQPQDEAFARRHLQQVEELWEQFSRQELLQLKQAHVRWQTPMPETGRALLFGEGKEKKAQLLQSAAGA